MDEDDDDDEEEDDDESSVEVRESLETIVTLFSGSSTRAQPVCEGPSAYLGRKGIKFKI